jgi:hypothetical protein
MKSGRRSPSSVASGPEVEGSDMSSDFGSVIMGWLERARTEFSAQPFADEDRGEI